MIAAKALRDFGRDQPALVIKGGLLGPRVLTAGRDRRRSPTSSPARCCSPGSPVGSRRRSSKAAGLFQAFTRNFAYGLKAYVDQRVEGGEALPDRAEQPTARGPSGAERPRPKYPAAASDADETADVDRRPTTESNTESDAEQAPADGVSPAAASDAIEEESN